MKIKFDNEVTKNQNCLEKISNLYSQLVDTKKMLRDLKKENREFLIEEKDTDELTPDIKHFYRQDLIRRQLTDELKVNKYIYRKSVNIIFRVYHQRE